MRGRGGLSAIAIGIGIGTGVAMCALPAIARADEPVPPPAVAAPPPVPAPAPDVRVWYGGEILGLDLVSITLPFVALPTRGSAGAVLAVAGLAGYLVGPPVVHAANGAGGRTVAGSIGLRVGLPVLGLAIGLAAGSAAEANCQPGDSDSCVLEAAFGAVVGIGVGVLAASIIDMTALAWKEPRSRVATASPPTVRLVPLVGMARDGRIALPTLGLAGSF